MRYLLFTFLLTPWMLLAQHTQNVFVCKEYEHQTLIGQQIIQAGANEVTGQMTN